MGEIVNVKIVEETHIFLSILPYITSLVCAMIAGFISWFIAHKQAKNEIKELDKKYKYDLEQYKAQDLYEMRKAVIFKTLNFLDDYISWLEIDGVKPTRKKDCSNSKFTFLARECYNELCVTVENQKLITLFYEILFGKSRCLLGKLGDFRNEARKELGLNEAELPKEVSFISIISTEDLAIKEERDRKCFEENK